MKYCKSCLTTSLRPNASFDNGICGACQYYQLKTNSQSESLQKLALLEQLISKSQKGRRKNNDYDCIVGVSGGKDSTRQAHWVRDRLGLRPLLVCCSYPPLQMSDIGASNLANLLSLGFDLINATPAPRTAQQLALDSFTLFGNLCKSTELSLFSTVPRLACSMDIDTIFWGENPAIQVGDSAAKGVDEFDGNNLRNLNTLTEGGQGWLNDSVTDKYKIDHYLYPEKIVFEKKNINIFYLGPAWDDWSNDNNATYAALNGLTLRPDEQEDTGDISNASMLDEEFSNINMMIKYFKFGFGRSSDLVNEEIRAGNMTRDEGIPIVERYDGLCSDRIIRIFCKYVGIDENNFWQVTNKFVNTDIFTIKDGKRPCAKFTVGTDYVS